MAGGAIRDPYDPSAQKHHSSGALPEESSAAVLRSQVKSAYHQGRDQWLPVSDAEWQNPPSSASITLRPGDRITTDDDEWPLPGLPPQLAAEFLASPGIYGSFGFRLESLFHQMGDRLRALWQREESGGIVLSCFVVTFALGIFVYFSLAFEPLAFVLVATALALGAIVLLRSHHDHWHYMALVALALTCGMLAAQLRTHLALSPSLDQMIKGRISGEILSVEETAKGSTRLLIRPITIEGIKPEAMPMKLRLSVRKPATKPMAGMHISGLAQMQAYSGPAYPGGYDFSFLPRFEGIGGTGFFMGKPEITPATKADKPSFQEWFSLKIEQLRAAIGERIRFHLPGGEGAVAVALIVGEQSGIPENVVESLRQSGLAHILSISGLHMALVTLTLIWFLRRSFSLFPGFVQTRPVRKYAAFLALLAASAYLVISGNSVASQRSWLMISIMLMAIMFDRRAMTLRSVAIAALIILVVSPESLFSASFQMSFAAVAALIAAFRYWSQRARIKRAQQLVVADHSPLRMGVDFLGRYLGAPMATSLVAGAATGLFSAWHFHRVALLGVVSNLLATPLVSIVVMPFALASMLLMPYGLEGLPLKVMGFGIEKVVVVSDWVNTLGSDRTTGILPPQFLFLATVGLVILIIFQTRLRLIGLGLIALAFWNAEPSRRPDLMISEDGRVVAVAQNLIFQPSGQLGENFLYPWPKRGEFIRNIWDKGWPPVIPPEADKAMANAQSNVMIEECGKDQCLIKRSYDKASNISAENYGRIAVVFKPELLAEACATADVLIAPRLKWVNCRGEHQPQVILRREEFANGGSHALYVEFPRNKAAKTLRDDGGSATNTETAKPYWRIETAVSPGVRPWSRKAVTWQDASPVMAGKTGDDEAAPEQN